MLKTLEDISPTRKRLKIEIPAEVVESEIQKALLNLQSKAKLPGFRPGKAPMAMIEKKFGKDVEAEVLERIIPESYLEAVKEADIKPVMQPIIEEPYEFQRNSPISMTLNVEVRPKVENLSYEGINIKEIPVEVKDEDVDKVLESLAEERAVYEFSEDAINSGDLITIDYTVADEGAESKDVVLKVGSGHYPAEFFDAITGRKKDEELEVEATFSDDSRSQFAGKRVKFKIKIKDVKRRNVPAIDNEFAKDLGFDNLESLKEKLKDNILVSKSKEADSTKQKEILDRIIESHSFELPEGLLNSEIGGIIGEIRAAGKDDRPDEALREEIKSLAEKRVKASILLEAIGEKEGITATDEDMKEEIFKMSQRFYMSPENVMKYYITRDGSLGGLRRSVFEKKVLGFLLSKAVIEK
ncbi:MAG: trigger factor [Thermodesulfovibrionales bacterium]|nr:trigger factor [Thermodesulfovibrionales bacterium]